MFGAIFAALIATSCPQFFAGGEPPTAQNVVQICFTGFRGRSLS